MSVRKFVLWDENDVRVEGEWPVSPPRNLLSSHDEDPLPFDLGAIVKHVENMNSMEYTVHSASLLGWNHYFVLSIATTTGVEIIVRVTNEGGADIETRQRLLDKVKRECAMMKWMASATSIPIPTVLSESFSNRPPFFLTTKCSGDLVVDAFGTMTPAQKTTNIQSYAQMELILFHVPCPQEIGSVVAFDQTDGSIELGGCIHPRMPSPLRTISDYFQQLIAMKHKSVSIGSEPSHITHAHTVLDRAGTLARTLCASLTPELLRCVPVHEDLVAHNVFVDASGAICGVIDWEFHTVKPAVLAATYPSWISAGGTGDRAFYPKGGQFTSWWLESIAGAEMLRAQYRKIVEHDADYYKALTEGIILRGLEGWLTSDREDKGCERFARWLDSVAAA